MILDIGMGILLAVFTSWTFDTELTTTIVVCGIVFALVPDVDVLWGWVKPNKWWKRGKWGHREVSHYPFFLIPVGIVIWVVWGGMWAFLYFLGVAWHLLHDSFDIIGVKLFWPFSSLNYSFHPRIAEKNINIRCESLAERTRHWSDGATTADWIKSVYVRKFLPFELLMLLFATVILCLYVR